MPVSAKERFIRLLMLLQFLSPLWWLSFIKVWWLWYLITALLGYLVFPILFGWLRSLPDRGYSISRIIGAFLLSYLNWILCHRFLQFSRWSIALTLVGILIFSLNALRKHHVEFFRHCRTRAAWIIATEILSIVLFMLLVNIRSYCSDIQYNPNYHGAEKLANMMLISSLMRTGNFPAEDAWFCRGEAMESGRAKPASINYYYGGHLQWATLARLTGTPPQIAFNLALATLFSWIGVGAFGLMLNLTQRIFPSVVCAILIVFAGNLEFIRQIPKMADAYEKWKQSYALSDGFDFQAFVMSRNFDLWRASRVILSEKFPDARNSDFTVNEFPYFSFILGDLHAHSSALPLTLALLVVLLSVFNRKQNTGEMWIGAWIREPGAAFLTALLVGGLYFYNAWEIIPLALLLVVFLVWDRNDWRMGKVAHCFSSTISGLLLFAFGLLVFFGLFTFQLQNPWDGNAAQPVYSTSSKFFTVVLRFWETVSSKFILRPFDLGSSARELILFWGLIWLPLAAFILVFLSRARKGPVNASTVFAGSILIFILAILGMLFGAPAVQITFALAVGAGIFAWRRFGSNESFAARLTFAAFAIVCVAECFVIDDAMTGRLERYNTVFKLYYPAWAELTICAVFFVHVRILEFWRSRQLGQVAAIGFSAFIMISAGMVYPVMATWTRTDGFYTAKGDPARRLYAMRPQEAYRHRTLDGLHFLSDPTESPDDLAAIRWLQKNVSGRPHILEASAGAYNYTGRVAAYAGLPTIIGWDNHEQQWRGWDKAPWVARRKNEVELAYKTTDVEEALRILAKYRIRFVFVGKLERSLYPTEGLEKFSLIGAPVFKKGQTTIYDVTVLPGGASEEFSGGTRP